ncbi:MAG TPA: LysM domain-containing protein [Aeromicrobium sp.]|nr:LysM domain-containing protein [Aeromicrobium sp.]
MTTHIPDLASVDLSTALNRLAGCLLVGTLAWAGLVTLLASWAPTARWARAITPRALRVTLFTAVSSALAVSPARAASDLDGLPLPSRGVTVAAEATGGHVVAAGESLWAISARALPPEAGPADVAHEAAAWYQRNRALIGPDPNLIHPGQVLLAPEGLR